MRKLSVKGLIIGTPEFYGIAKEGERQFEHRKNLKKARKAIDKIDCDMITEKEAKSLEKKVSGLY